MSAPLEESSTEPAPPIVQHDQDMGLSVLSDLKSRRQKIADEQIMPLSVPRWHDPVIKVKYRPVPHEVVRGITDRVDKASKQDKGRVEVDANIDILIRSCAAVVAVVGGKEYSLRLNDPNGEPTKFDPDLAENLGLDRNAGARAVVKELFMTDADIIAAAGAVGEFSGYKEQEGDEVLAGES